MTLEGEQSHNEDISIFIKSQLKFDEGVDEQVLDEIRSEILTKSSGIFLWVNLAVHQLNQVERRDGRMEEVRKRLQEIPRAAKENYATGAAMPLYGLFRDIILKDDRNIVELVRLIQVVFCAKRPLRPKELFVILHRSYDKPFNSSKVSDDTVTKHVLDFSKGLAEVILSKEPTVQFIHETVREFLRDGGLRIVSPLSSQQLSADGHEVLKRSCLDQVCAPVGAHLPILAKYQAQERYRNDRRLPDSAPVTMEQQQEFIQEARSKFPFLEYASQNLLFHANEAQSLGTPQDDFLERFPAAEWIPIRNLFEKFNKRRYSAKQTPTLYILADHACNDLIKLPTAFREGYPNLAEDEEFSSALACAIYSGHLDTVYTLLGLDAKDRPQNIPWPGRKAFRKSVPFMRMLAHLQDPQLLRKAAADGHIYPFDWAIDAKSLDMLDILVGCSVVPGFPSAGQFKESEARHRTSSSPETDLFFIRQAIDLDHKLLFAEVWDMKTMLDFTAEKEFAPLARLGARYSSDRTVSENLLRQAIAANDFASVKHALEVEVLGADLSSQDKYGRTACHLAAISVLVEGGIHLSLTTPPLQILFYLFSRVPNHAYTVDHEGKTAWAIIAPLITNGMLLQPLLNTGVDPNIILGCSDCSHHEFPLIVATVFDAGYGNSNFDILASHQECHVDLPDNLPLGRTALSWCFTHRHGVTLSDDSIPFYIRNLAGTGKRLLRNTSVNVNSRDFSAVTVLEHFIRHPRPSQIPEYTSFVDEFFRSERLDPNLRTSNDQAPLELIVSLYNMWPAAFGDLRVEWFTATGSLWYPGPVAIKGNDRRQEFSQHLIRALKLLLGTNKVNIDVRKRCASTAPPELKRIIEETLHTS